MKIGLITGLMLIYCSIAFSQVTDTLGYSEFLTATPSLYTSPNGGYAIGNNGYGDMAKAQSYFHENSFVLREVLVQFGHVGFNSTDSSSAIRVNVYDNYGFGITSLGESDSIAPDSVLGFVDIPVYQLLDNADFTSASFAHDTLAIFSRFSVGVDFSGLNPLDTVGIWSTTDGDASGSYNAWELTSNGDWFTVEQPSFSWGLEVDLAIFPVIDENDPAGVLDPIVNLLRVFPNPCSDVLYLPTDLKFSGLAIHDMVGKKVQEVTVNSFNGLYVSELNPGVYYLSVETESGTVTGKFIKQ